MTPSNFKELNRDAALRFLQTAVVVDDAATVSSQGRRGGSLITPGAAARARAAKSERDLDGTETEPTTAPRVPVDVKALSDALADRGITCGVLKPTKDEPEEIVIDRVVSVSAQVDLVILDWVLDQDRDLTSLNAIKRIVSDDHKGCRVVAIYTSQESLADIATELEQNLDGVERGGDGGLMLAVGGTRIGLFRKAGVEGSGIAADSQHYTETELADQLIEAFLDIAQGWVRGVALNTLAAIRENFHAVLSRLGPSLDLGYAGHLLRLEHVDDGAFQLLDSVAGELRGVIEDDSRSHEIAGPTGFSDWIGDREEKDEIATSRELLDRFVAAAPSERNEIRAEVLNDLKNHDLIPQSGFKRQQFEPSTTALFTSDFAIDSAREADGAFAMLLALRHSYAGTSPTLRLGTILSDSDCENYWLCIQPDCDSVRLEGQSFPFPLIPLQVIASGDGQPFHFLVPRSEGDVQLFNPATPAAVVNYSFKPDHSGSVRFRFTRAGPDKPVVRTTGGKTFVWAAQLKPIHAARVAHGLGQRLSRIGLDESEWLHSRSP